MHEHVHYSIWMNLNFQGVYLHKITKQPFVKLWKNQQNAEIEGQWITIYTVGLSSPIDNIQFNKLQKTNDKMIALQVAMCNFLINFSQPLYA